MKINKKIMKRSINSNIHNFLKIKKTIQKSGNMKINEKKYKNKKFKK